MVQAKQVHIPAHSIGAFFEMGDVRAQLTPETPGRVHVLNPFESPNDYCSLHEPFVSSPTVFKPTKSSATPRQFRWSIDQLAAINPVDIDPEDVHRQALYLSHAKLDKEIEERRQKAIEEFFTKRTIVPSPWTQHEGKQAAQFHSTKCVDINESPLAREQVVTPGKSTVACQTQLSLPADFDIEKVLGEYFRTEENADQSQENLSSSSLRRKLFLDGQFNGSECSSPSSPAPGSYEAPPASLGVLCSIDLSPVRCRSPMQTPSSGQFSSSPIQGGRRAYSLGSIESPTFFEKSPMREMSPAFSPISSALGRTPMAEQKKLSFPSPEALSASKSMVNSCTASPLIEGCSPIRSVFQIKAKSCRESAQYRTSLFQIPFTIERLEEKENSPPTPLSLPKGSIVLQLQNMDTFSPTAHIIDSVESLSPKLCTQQMMVQATEERKENDTVEMVDPAESEDDHIWVKDAAGNNTPMTSFMTCNTFSVETSHMCMSPLAESSVIPCDNSSIQVDSGYTTQTCVSSLMDGIGTDGVYKENDAQACENQNGSQHIKTKDFLTMDVKGHRLLELESPDRDCPLKTHKTHPALHSGTWKLSSDRLYNRLNKNVRLQSPQQPMDGKPVSHF
ncbi:LOW QUALITY PROTEIN: protein aurora borealis [Hyla sarda]|uniref:LOW QUALITY PROTEIN: protein aurora borealis n=1 Tax=Hyla sarda TaxID=327740 RepID=UPI0024C34044|nr:LOW QUALITY PROTEIN: protein aurora borealis [Hyla sarda]